MTLSTDNQHAFFRYLPICIAQLLIGLVVLVFLFGKPSKAAIPSSIQDRMDFLFSFAIRGYHTDAGFVDPSAIALDQRSGLIYVADKMQGVVDAFSFQGIAKFQYGPQNGLKAPLGLAVDSHGNVFVSESDGGPIKIIHAAGNVTTLDIPTPKGGEAPKPGRMTFDQDGNLYVVDRANCQVVVFDRTLKLKFTVGGYGIQQGLFKKIEDVAVDRQGRIYVLDSVRTPVQVFDRKGHYIYQFGMQGVADDDLSFPAAICIDRNDQAWIVDKTEHDLKVFDRAGIFLRKFGTYGLSQGDFFYPIDIAIDDLGHVYVLESGTRRVQVFTLTRPFDPFNPIGTSTFP